MTFYLIIIFLSLSWAVYEFVKERDNLKNNVALFFTIATVLYGIFVLGLIISGFINNPTLYFITEWARTWGVSWILVGIFLINRNDRPPVARFPYFLIFIPLVIPISYLAIHQTLFIKDLVVSLYEFAALVTGITMFLFHQTKGINCKNIIVGSVLLFASVILNWFPFLGDDTMYALIKLFQVSGIILFAKGFINYTKSLQHK